MDCWKNIRTLESPKVYRRYGQLAQVVPGRMGSKIKIMDEADVYGAVIRSSSCVKQLGGGFKDERPPADVARDMISSPDPKLPDLDAIVPSPVFVEGGRLVSRPGYDSGSRLYYDESSPIPPVAEVLAESDLVAARDAIQEILDDFRFASTSDRAAAWGTLFAPFVRRLISGPLPVHLIEAPQSGSGKSLFADIVSLVFTGRTANMTTIGADEEEIRKKLTALMMYGRPIVTIDNLDWGSKSAVLSAMLTSETMEDRILGKSELVELENIAVWVITVNNPDFNIDMARRCSRVRIIPTEVTAFRHPLLKVWVRQNRPKLTHAVLTCCKWWVQAGMPLAKKTIPSFESWAATIGGILESIGLPDFLLNHDEFLRVADSDTAAWLEFLEIWWERFKDTEVSVKELHDSATDSQTIGAVLGDRGDQSQRVRLGRALGRLRDRVLGQWRVRVHPVNPHTKCRLYSLEPMGGS